MLLCAIEVDSAGGLQATRRCGCDRWIGAMIEGATRGVIAVLKERGSAMERDICGRQSAKTQSAAIVVEKWRRRGRCWETVVARRRATAGVEAKARARPSQALLFSGGVEGAGDGGKRKGPRGAEARDAEGKEGDCQNRDTSTISPQTAWCPLLSGTSPFGPRPPSPPGRTISQALCSGQYAYIAAI